MEAEGFCHSEFLGQWSFFWFCFAILCIAVGYLLPIWNSSIPVSYAGDPAASSWDSATQTIYRTKYWNQESLIACRCIFTLSEALDKCLNYVSWCKVQIDLKCLHRPP